jgi:DNA-binding transcriptional LysR family regulator
MEATDGLEGFVEIVERGSLTAAADVLGLPRSTLSRQLSRLEERMGVRLLHRTTRRVVPTRAGEELFRRARRIVDEAREAVEAVRRHDDVPRGLLRVTAPPSYDEMLAEPILSFLAAHPHVQVELDASSRTVDLVAEGFDVAIRGRAVAGSNLIVRSLLRADAVAVASPAYLDARGRPSSPGALAGHDLILGADGGGAPERTWPLRDGGTVAVQGRLSTNDVLLRRAAAVRGQGITMLPHPMTVAGLRDGRLEPVLPEALGTRGAASIVYPERAFLQAKVRAFVDHLVAWAERLPPDACVAHLGKPRGAR